MKSYSKIFVLLSLCMITISLQSCTKMLGNRLGRSIRCNVTGVATKGSTITTSSSDPGKFPITTDGFKTIAYAEERWYNNESAVYTDAGIFFGKDDVLYNKLGDGKWHFSGEHKWLNDIQLTFWSWDMATDGIIGTGAGKVTQPSYTLGTKKLSFSYQLPTHTAANTDAESQVDMVFAGNFEKRVFDDDGNMTESHRNSGGKTDNTKSEYIDIHFYHALSEVMFAVSPADGTFDKTVKIKDITISGISPKGDCTFDGKDFTWNNLSETASFTQTYNADFSTYSNSKKDFTGWTLGQYTKDKGLPTEAAHDIYSCNEKFFLIPQTCGSSARLIVTFVNGSIESTSEAMINGDSWKPGYYYKYKINYVASGEEVTFGILLVEFEEIPVPISY